MDGRPWHIVDGKSWLEGDKARNYICISYAWEDSKTLNDVYGGKNEMSIRTKQILETVNQTIGGDEATAHVNRRILPSSKRRPVEESSPGKNGRYLCKCSQCSGCALKRSQKFPQTG